ncbi:MAG: restriction endonuclease subunit S [Parasporobacterium sp.]|nr:restriction endonuclease subunit S [Parasporobacterium sp.]
MGLTKYRLGELVEISSERNDGLKYGIDSVKGISIQKEFIETKADMEGVSLIPYFLVRPDDFVYVTVTSRNGDKITLAHNDTKSVFIVSSSYIVFRVKRMDLLLSDYLFLYFNRPEFDRYSRFNSWGSARETFSWEDLCDIEIELPSISVQQKFVSIYKAMVANQQSYEQGLNDLVLLYEGYLDKLRRSESFRRIGDYIELIESRNETLEYRVKSVKGVSIEKKFIDTKADMTGVSLKPYYVVRPNEFAYVPVTSRNGDKISIAINDSDETYICSSSYIVFKSKDENILYPQYLMLFFSRGEFNRYARFNSWGSARETFDWSEMCDVEIPIPDIGVQKAIAEIYSVYIERKKINELLKAQIKDICPVLIRGSLEYGG